MCSIESTSEKSIGQVLKSKWPPKITIQSQQPFNTWQFLGNFDLSNTVVLGLCLRSIIIEK
jgi:hypothetical protein